MARKPRRASLLNYSVMRSLMTHKPFTQIHNQKKKKINISLDADLKAKLVTQKSVDGISISERVEALYRNHKEAVESIFIPNYDRSRGERGKPMYGDAIRQTCGIFLTTDAIAFFDKLAKKKKSDRSQIIESSLNQIVF